VTVDHLAYCAALLRELDRFTALVARADLGRPVPACPGWDLARLVGHLGGTHRWVTAMVAAGAREKLAYEPFRAAVPADPRELVCWLANGAAELVALLIGTPPDRPVWGWGPDPRVAFWPRRMLHEAAVHRADAAAAVGAPVDVAPEVAADGIDEYLANLPYTAELAGMPGLPAGVSTLVATDTGATWQLSATGRAVSATVVELYLFVWGRTALNMEVMRRAARP
jgi:uncharacterized protein (TIGR03083 family)